MPQIFVFGDSIAYGAWDIEGGWVQRLRRWIDKRVIDSNYEEYFSIFNLGVGGDTAKNVIDRFEAETKARILDAMEEEKIFTFSIGGNDSMLINKTNKTQFTPEQFKENLKLLIKLSRKYSTKIIFKSETPIDEPRVTPLPWAPEYSYKESHTKEFNEIIKSVAREDNIHFIDVYKEFEKLDYKKLLADGCHPTTKGHKIIFEIVKDYLIKNKII